MNNLKFEAKKWELQIPENIILQEATSVARDSKNNIYVFNRGSTPMLVFSEEGKLINGWGKGEFVRPHGIFIDDNDELYLVDDGGHFLKKCNKEGDVLMTIGAPGEPSKWQSGDYFNRPTDVTVDSYGNIYISDGYGNSRIHKFSHNGQYIKSWGSPGTEEGQFNLPHNICLIEDKFLWVCDRENFRVQIFDTDGKWIKSIPFHRPQTIYRGKGELENLIIIGEAGTPTNTQIGVPNIGNCIKIVDYSGNTLIRLGDSQPGEGTDQFISPHGVTSTSKGDIIIAEVSYTAYGSKLDPPREAVSIRRWNLN